MVLCRRVSSKSKLLNLAKKSGPLFSGRASFLVKGRWKHDCGNGVFAFGSADRLMENAAI